MSGRRGRRLSLGAALAIGAALLVAVPLAMAPTSSEAGPVARIDGADPVGLAVTISQQTVLDHSVDDVLVADATDLTHALGAGAATGQFPTPTPLLFTPPDSLAAAVGTEMARVLPSTDKADHHVLLIGPSFAAGGPVETAITTLGFTVEHIAGTNPAATAALLARRTLLGGGYERTVLLVPPSDTAAAAAMGAWGASRALPVLLAGSADTVPPETLAYISDTAATTVVVAGDVTATSAAQVASLRARGLVVRRASAPDPVALSSQIAATWADSTLVTGTALSPIVATADGPRTAALASAVIASRNAARHVKSPLLLLPGPGLPPSPADACAASDGRGPACYLLASQPGPLTVVGSPALVSAASVATVEAARVAPRDSYAPNFSHVFVLVFENKNYDEIFGPGNSAAAPYLNALVNGQTQATNFYGITHQSLGNYIGLVSGLPPSAATQQDCPQYDCTADDATAHLGDQLDQANKSWRGYFEGMAQPCQHPPEGQGDQYFVQGAPPGNTYATRHNPWMYFGNMIHNQARCDAHDVPLSQLDADLGSPRTPNFSLVVPDLCDDGHDTDQQCQAQSGKPGGITAIDAFAQKWVTKIMASPAFQDGGVIFVTFDEAEGTGTNVDNRGCCATPLAPGGGKVGTVVISPTWGRETAFEDPTPYNHYNLLHTIEAAWGLPTLGYSGDSRSYVMSSLFRRPSTSGGTGPSAPPVSAPDEATWYFAEGTTRPGFTEYITLANAAPQPVTATLTWFTTSARFGAPTLSSTVSTHVLAPDSRTTIDAAAPGEAGPNQDASVLVTLTGQGAASVVAERPMYFHGSFGFGATDGSIALGARQPSRDWYFAEGTTRPGFQEYLTIENPGPATTADVTYLVKDVAAGASSAITHGSLQLAAGSRTTLDVNAVDEAGANRDVAVAIHAAAPIVAERPLYFAAPIAGAGMVDGGHDAVGATGPDVSWFFAEGTTRPGFQEYLTLQNPATSAASATLHYQLVDAATGTRATKSVAVSLPPASRTTVDVNAPDQAGPNQDVSVRVAAGAPIVVERPLYFTTAQAGGLVTGGDVVVGQPGPSTSWLLAEGTTRPGFVEYLTLQNPGPTAVAATVTYIRRDAGSAADSTRDVTVTLPAESRTTLVVNDGAQAGPNQDVSARVVAAQPIVVERPIYFFGVIDGAIKGGHVQAGWPGP